MPFLSDETTVAANQVVANVLEGKFNRVLQENSKVSIGMTAELAGDGFGSILLGKEVLMDDQVLPPTNAFPRNPEDILVQGVGGAGEEIIVRVRNANAAATNDIRTAVYIEPI